MSKIKEERKDYTITCVKDGKVNLSWRGKIPEWMVKERAKMMLDRVYADRTIIREVKEENN